MNSRAALAIVLFAAFALLSDPGSTGKMVRAGPALFGPTAETAVLHLHRGPSPRDLHNDCAIIATEAASRLVPTGSWTHVIFIRFIESSDGRTYIHALAVWQPPTSTCVLIYDAGGTLDLGKACGHDPAKIAKAWGKFANAKKILEAHFL